MAPRELREALAEKGNPLKLSGMCDVLMVKHNGEWASWPGDLELAPSLFNVLEITTDWEGKAEQRAVLSLEGQPNLRFYSTMGSLSLHSAKAPLKSV